MLSKIVTRWSLLLLQMNSFSHDVHYRYICHYMYILLPPECTIIEKNKAVKRPISFKL